MENQPMRERAYLAENTDVIVNPATSAGKKKLLGSRAKGLVALGLGAALLTGGATTLAYWQSTASIANQGVSTGKLSVVAPIEERTVSLQGVAHNGETSLPDTGAIELVPGDVLTITQPVTLTVQGETLAADLATVLGGTASVAAGNGTITSDVEVQGLASTSGITEASLGNGGTMTSVATITIQFNEASPTGNNVHTTTQSEDPVTVDAAAIKLVLSQVIAP